MLWTINQKKRKEKKSNMVLLWYGTAHSDFDMIIYHQPIDASFLGEIKSIWYNAALAISGAIKGIPKQKLFKELSLESLKERRWFHKMCHLYKIISYEIWYRMSSCFAKVVS